MTKWCIGVFFLVLCWTSLIAQAPSLDIFTSDDGTFQFVYPQNYELLVGERILNATQGRRSGISVCDFSTALVCVIYPIETVENTNFEAAGFSVDAVPGTTSEADCLAYSDRSEKIARENPAANSIAINNHVFRHTSTRRTTPGHSLATDSYRTFQNEKCYELQVQVSVSDERRIQNTSGSNSMGDARADSARESLKLILSSFVFRP